MKIASTAMRPPTTNAPLRPVGRSAAFDLAKVARIAEALAAGRYTIDAGAIAHHLLSNAHDLLVPRHAAGSGSAAPSLV